MKWTVITLTMLCCTISLAAQQQEKWGNWKWLLGEWFGEGSGQPGQGGGTFSFSFDLDSNVLIRKSHSSYPGSGNRPATIHNDLMIVYPSMDGVPFKAVYFDNEGHTIFYKVKTGAKDIELTSEKAQNLPVFRLTYTLLENGMVNTKFEMSQDGEKFMTYIEGKSKKIKE